MPTMGRLVLRLATAADVDTLVALEQACGLEALGHVFPPAQFPYPTGEVRDRWQVRLADQDATTVLAVDDVAVGFVCVRRGVVHHLGVDPSRQRQGIGALLLDEAVRVARAESVDQVSLWCLVDNHRALSFYAGRGWLATGERRPAEFPPHPVEECLVLAG